MFSANDRNDDPMTMSASVHESTSVASTVVTRGPFVTSVRYHDRESKPLYVVDKYMPLLRGRVLDAVTRVKALLAAGNIVVPGKSDLELSHHYGMERFDEFGLTMVTVVNREYCKKLLVMLPGQTHPEQYHEKKEETFVVLYGQLDLWLDGEHQQAVAGDVITVQRGVRHRFHSAAGTVFEEISSTHVKDDSYYTDPAIADNPRRKTWLTYWM